MLFCLGKQNLIWTHSFTSLFICYFLIIREEDCTMVWLFWLFYRGDRASGLLLSRPVTSVKHSDNFFLTNSLCPLCSNPPTVDIIVVIMIIFSSVIVIIILTNSLCQDTKSWHCHDLCRHWHLCRHKVGRCWTLSLAWTCKVTSFSFGVFGTGICWRTECLSCQAVLSLFKLMGLGKC